MTQLILQSYPSARDKQEAVLLGRTHRLGNMTLAQSSLATTYSKYIFALDIASSVPRFPYIDLGVKCTCSFNSLRMPRSRLEPLHWDSLGRHVLFPPITPKNGRALTCLNVCKKNALSTFAMASSRSMSRTALGKGVAFRKWSQTVASRPAPVLSQRCPKLLTPQIT